MVFGREVEIPEFKIRYHKEMLIYQGEGGAMSEKTNTVGSLKGQLSKFSGIIGRRF